MDTELIVGSIITVVALILMPLYIRHQAAVQAKLAQERADRLAASAGEEVSWEAINKTIIAERNMLKEEVREQAIEFENKVRELQRQFEEEAERIKKRGDYELDRANEKIKQLGEEVNVLYRRLGGATNGGS